MTDANSDELREMLQNLKEAKEIYEMVEEITENFTGKTTPIVLGIVTGLVAKVVHSAAPDKTAGRALMFEIMIRANGITEALFLDEEEEEDDDENEEKPLQ